MEWLNILAIVMPVVLVMIVGIFYNNRRIDDLRSDMNQRLTVMQEDIREIKNFMMELLKRESGWVIREK
ncbi:hypothetical protein H8E88_21440 [candidate division KSB1 bacterium]|nr:hypothetical protein [candidate division KSB1 bacterium]MBL7094093.1 hypothetical protein [candidate division KSB1 bacterium]